MSGEDSSTECILKTFEGDSLNDLIGMFNEDPCMCRVIVKVSIFINDIGVEAQ
jgi:hypothetical protein